MNRVLRYPRLPDGKVTWALISGEFPWLKDALAPWGVRILLTDCDPRLPEPVGFHPDLQVCPLPDKRLFVLRGSPIEYQLKEAGFAVQETQEPPGDTYPEDVRCGGLVWNNYLVGNPKGLDRNLICCAQEIGLEILPVRQGYTACSVALVDQQSAITADRGLYRALTEQGFEMLLIQPGFIQLPGYDTGFLGGCCGKLSPDMLAFTGRLSSHPDGLQIRRFLEERGVTAVELTDGPLLDVGGIVPLFEKPHARIAGEGLPKENTKL
ncbi:MAG: DUF6873 family GME fold protein [Acutalibacter sp.]|jgi:hypothetical protein